MALHGYTPKVSITVLLLIMLMTVFSLFLRTGRLPWLGPAFVFALSVLLAVQAMQPGHMKGPPALWLLLIVFPPVIAAFAALGTAWTILESTNARAGQTKE